MIFLKAIFSSLLYFTLNDPLAVVFSYSFVSSGRGITGEPSYNPDQNISDKL